LHQNMLDIKHHDAGSWILVTRYWLLVTGIWFILLTPLNSLLVEWLIR
jgi:hypothetical protein